MTQKIFDLIRSFAILYGMLWLGEWIFAYVHLGIPASIWGLLLLFICLTLRIIKLDWVFLSSSLLIRYMALLFVPVSVGIVKYADILLAQIKVLLIPNILSTCFTLVFVGLFSDYLFSRKSFAYLRKKVVRRQMEKAR
ncbi:CidA/LrgA family protein [Pasteurella oralis]|uniref:CidA/LrgA family protein n=1 Tax=Pasteurella oralis TaxID=1071947 RepID=A0ABW4NYD6_9PAST|nr:CidA/LrgA family protein [Pasteurella oralis]